MLPKSLKNSYAQYKDDTDRFATWLLAAAEKCGYQSNLGLAGDPTNSSNSSTKAKSKAKSNSTPILPPKYKATISELRTLGEVVARSSMKIPDSILVVARRAVALRKHATLWFFGKGSSESNKRHAHFVQVLEDICESLEWRTNEPSPNAGSGPSSATVTSANGKTDAKAVDEAWINRFAELTVEEPEEVLEQGDGSKQLIRVEVVQEDNVDLKDPEQISQSHAFFRAFCLFQDLNNMRDFLLQTWDEYRDNKLDLMTASVVTDTALQLARAAIEELVRDPSMFPDLQDDEMALHKMLYDVTCMARGHYGDASVEHGLPFNINAADTVNWFFVIPQILLASFVPVIQQGDTPDFIKGYFGVIDKHADRSRMSVGERLQEDKILFLELLPEFCLMKAHGLKWPVRDEITYGFVEFVKTKKPTIWHCFAVQILLDIYHTLRLKPDGPWTDLSMAGLRMSKTITDFKALSATHPKPAFWPKEGDQEIQNIQKCIDTCIKRDPQLGLWQYAQMSVQTHDEHFFFKKNPILCGLLSFQLTLRMQVIGQGLVNQWYDVQQMAFREYHSSATVPQFLCFGLFHDVSLQDQGD